MTPDKQSTFKLNRLRVYSKSKIVYDEKFHVGVNIIRGTNSSGKSTVMDFIFFVLGGDFVKWKPEAAACDHVYAEVEINDAILTLKRKVTSSPRQSMYVYWGVLEESLKYNVEGWQEYQFQRSANKESYSQVLFRSLGFPEIRGDGDSNITMHQILRLIYVDQLSNIESIFRDEDFDAPLTRRTIGDLLLGIYDDSVHAHELRLKIVQKEIDGVNSQINTLLAVLGEADREIDINKVTKNILETEEQFKRVQDAIAKYDLLENSVKTRDDSSVFDDLRKQFLEYQTKLIDAQNHIKDLQYEIEDSRAFIKSMEDRLKAFDQAVITRKSIGELQITNCPKCLSPLIRHVPEGTCILCKQPVSIDLEKSMLLKMKEELFFQVKESKNILVSKEDRLAQIMREIPILTEQTHLTKSNLDEALTKVKTARDTHLDDLLVKKGSLENQLIFLHKQAKSLSFLEKLKNQKNSLNNEMQNLQIAIKSKRDEQRGRLSQVMTLIFKHALHLLSNDLDREELFKTAKSLDISFDKNTFSLEGRNQFSASSMVYLKNCIHYAIYFASLDLDFMRYPRLIICDNMEDKGMEEIRSRNFQKVIVELAKQYNIKHQIIFTTSMIDSSLDNELLCVGQKYTKANKSLKLS